MQCFNTDTEFIGSVAPHQTVCPTPPLLTWKIAQKKLPWGIVLLLGGGFALAKGSEVSDSDSHNVNGKLGQELTHNMDNKNNNVSGAGSVVVASWLAVFKVAKYFHEIQPSFYSIYGR